MQDGSIVGSAVPPPFPPPPPLPPRPVITTFAWTLAIIFAASIVQSFLVVGILVARSGGDFDAAMLDAEQVEADGFIWAVSSIAFAAVGSLSIGLATQFSAHGSPGEQLGFRRPSVGPVVLWTVAALATGIAFDFVGSFFGRPVVAEVVLNAYQSAGSLPLLWFAIVVVAPVFEEVMFRGFILGGLAPSRMGPVAAVLISSAVWAVLHLQYDVVDILWIFGLGILMGFAFLRTRSVWVTISMHVAINLLSMIQTAAVANAR